MPCARLGGSCPGCPQFVHPRPSALSLFVPIGRAPHRWSSSTTKPAPRAPNSRELELPDSIRKGPAAHRHVVAAGELSRWCLRNSPSRSTAKSGAWISELMPVSRPKHRGPTLTFIKSVHTEAINHDPGRDLFLQTGRADRGKRSRAWVRGSVVWIGRGNPGAAGLRGDDLAWGRPPADNRSYEPAVGRGISAVSR
jgi:hypothetical protein